MFSLNNCFSALASMLSIVSASPANKFQDLSGLIQQPIQPPPPSHPHGPAIPHTVQIDVPTFTSVYDATMLFSPDVPDHFLPGPFGDRAFVGFLGGNLTDPKTGALVANVVPNVGGMLGIKSTSNHNTYTDVNLFVQWADDHKFAFLKGYGVGAVGNTSAATTYGRMETDSPSRQNLVNRVLLFSIVILPESVSPPGATLAYFKLFVKSNSDGTFSG